MGSWADIIGGIKSGMGRLGLVGLAVVLGLVMIGGVLDAVGSSVNLSDVFVYLGPGGLAGLVCLAMLGFVVYVNLS